MFYATRTIGDGRNPFARPQIHAFTPDRDRYAYVAKTNAPLSCFHAEAVTGERAQDLIARGARVVFNA